MAKRQRNYSADQARRNQLARDAGWSSRSQQRYAKEKLKASSADVQGKWGYFLSHKGKDLNKQDQEKAFRAFWQGLIDKRTRDERGRNSARAEWFVDWIDVVEDYDKWLELYG